MYAAGGETVRFSRLYRYSCCTDICTPQTSGAILVFLIVMAQHPEIQKRAQKELDTVIGSNRLPLVSDRDDLPYVNAVAKEVLRWRPILPLSKHS